MGNAYGFIETEGVTAAADALDIMCKAADISFVTWERKLGGRLVTVIIQGSISSVQEAVEAATAGAIKKPVVFGTITSPHEEIIRLIKKSASRLK